MVENNLTRLMHRGGMRGTFAVSRGLSWQEDRHLALIGIWILGRGVTANIFQMDASCFGI